MFKTFLVFFSAFVFSVASYSKISESKNKKSASKKIESRKSASEVLEPPFSCEVVTQTQKQKQISKIILNDESQVPGTEAHQQVKIFSRDGRQGMVVNSFFENPAHPYFIDSMSCDAEMRCEATRVKYQKARTISQPLNVAQNYDGVTAVLGRAVIFRYASMTNGFRIQNVQLEMDGYNAVGVTITCQGK